MASFCELAEHAQRLVVMLHECDPCRPLREGPGLERSYHISDSAPSRARPPHIQDLQVLSMLRTAAGATSASLLLGLHAAAATAVPAPPNLAPAWWGHPVANYTSVGYDAGTLDVVFSSDCSEGPARQKMKTVYPDQYTVLTLCDEGLSYVIDPGSRGGGCEVSGRPRPQQSHTREDDRPQQSHAREDDDAAHADVPLVATTAPRPSEDASHAGVSFVQPPTHSRTPAGGVAFLCVVRCAAIVEPALN